MAILKRKNNPNSEPTPKISPPKHKPGPRSHLLKGMDEAVSTRSISKLKEVQIREPDPVFQSPSPLADIPDQPAAATQDSIHRQLMDYRNVEVRKIESELKSFRQQQFSQIESEKQDVLDAAYHEGVTQGKQAGYNALKPEIDRLLSEVNEISKQKAKILEDLKPELLQLSLTMAQRIIRTVLEENPDHFNNIVEEALTKITDKEKVVIRVNAEHLTVLRKNKDKIHQSFPDIRHLEIQEDNKVEFGGCVIETKMGYVDASLPMKLETLNQTLFARLAEDAHQ